MYAYIKICQVQPLVLSGRAVDVLRVAAIVSPAGCRVGANVDDSALQSCLSVSLSSLVSIDFYFR